MDFQQKYGPWALIAGASEGLGQAFTEAIAARGLNLILIARRSAVLESLAHELRERHGVETRCLSEDLANPDLNIVVEESTRDVEVGLIVYNAAYVPTGLFAETDEESLQRVVRTNVLGPVIVLRKLVPLMLERKRGGVVLMSSVAGFQGVPLLAGYAASKAFTTSLGESLWGELRHEDIDVVSCCSGAVPTPGYRRSYKQDVPGMLSPNRVAEQTLRSLEKGPRLIPGTINRVVSQILNRLLSRRQAISIMHSNARRNLR